jgi:hypothetical protein
MVAADAAFYSNKSEGGQSERSQAGLHSQSLHQEQRWVGPGIIADNNIDIGRTMEKRGAK